MLYESRHQAERPPIDASSWVRDERVMLERAQRLSAREPLARALHAAILRMPIEGDEAPSVRRRLDA